MARLNAATGAGPRPHGRGDGASFDVDLADVGQRLAEGVRVLPGVVDVFPVPSGFFRWSGEPSVRLHQVDGRVHAAVSIGVGSRRSAPSTADSVRAHLWSRLEADGFAVGGVRVQVALVE